jgi:hypothetical protein
MDSGYPTTFSGCFITAAFQPLSDRPQANALGPIFFCLAGSHYVTQQRRQRAVQSATNHAQ